MWPRSLLSTAAAAAALATLQSTWATPVAPRDVARGGGVRGPVVSQNFADPSLRLVDGTFYSFATEGGNHHIQIAKSADFDKWELLDQDALPDLARAKWIDGGNDLNTDHVWAPDVRPRPDGGFIMYFAASAIYAPPKHCVGIALSDHIEGPYIPEPEPFVCHTEQGGAIDASGFQDTDGTLYVAYKIDGVSAGKPTILNLQKMVSHGPRAGIDPAPDSPPVALYSGNTPGRPTVEAPMLRFSHESRTYFLFFSENYFASPAYNVAYATSRSLTGPYERAAKPLLATGSMPGVPLNGPGGASVNHNLTKIVFHNRQKGPDSNFVRNLWTGETHVKGDIISF